MDAEEELRIFHKVRFIMDFVKINKNNSNCLKCYSGL